MKTIFVNGFILITLCLLCCKVDFARSGPCPCPDETLCERITKKVNKEVLVWSTSDTVWQFYNWSVVTTVAIFHKWNDELMCLAHSKVGKYVSHDS